MPKDKSFGLKQPKPASKWVIWKTDEGWARSDQFGSCERGFERDGEWVPQ
jgi:hypothetical protein